MADIVYVYGNKPYLNITNRCPCRCTFCIRQNGDGLGSADTLWHRVDPTEDEVLAALGAFDFAAYDEVIFCGYGEPTAALEVLKSAAAYLRKAYPALRIRLNTNGLGDLVNGRSIAAELVGLVDVVSISLNAPTREKYLAVTRPSFGEVSFDAMLAFAVACKNEGLRTMLTVVDVIPTEDIEASRALADSIGIPLRVREYTAD